jgi:lipopolysaccharide biosynthesis protein
LPALADLLRTWRRALKAKLPYVRRRDYGNLQRRHDALIEAIDVGATPAASAQLQVVKPLAQPLRGELCLFVSFADQPQLKTHVAEHVRHLIGADIQVILVVNTDLPATAVQVDPELSRYLAAILVRENVGFDFGAWAQAWSLLEHKQAISRLYLVNDSIVGPLNDRHFARMLDRVRNASADVIGLTECLAPRRHLQSYFLVFGAAALRSDAMQGLFQRVMNWPDKSQVIEIYESRLTALLESAGLNCEALFPSLWGDPASSDDTSTRWAELVAQGFPYLKTRTVARHATDSRIRAWLSSRPGTPSLRRESR